LPKSNGFLIIEANGGLNQQRLSVCLLMKPKILHFTGLFICNSYIMFSTQGW